MKILLFLVVGAFAFFTRPAWAESEMAMAVKGCVAEGDYDQSQCTCIVKEMQKKVPAETFTAMANDTMDKGDSGPPGMSMLEYAKAAMQSAAACKVPAN